MDAILELIAKLRAAPCGSRELDAKIARALGWRTSPDGYGMRDYWLPPGAEWSEKQALPPAWTTSIDAALTLLPNAAEWIVRTAAGPFAVHIFDPTESEKHKFVTYGMTAFLAICIAALTAWEVA